MQAVDSSVQHIGTREVTDRNEAEYLLHGSCNVQSLGHADDAMKDTVVSNCFLMYYLQQDSGSRADSKAFTLY